MRTQTWKPHQWHGAIGSAQLIFPEEGSRLRSTSHLCASPHHGVPGFLKQAYLSRFEQFSNAIGQKSVTWDLFCGHAHASLPKISVQQFTFSLAPTDQALSWN